MFDVTKMGYDLIGERINQILKCNEVSEKYKIVLKEEEVRELIVLQQDVLRDVGLIEFDGLIIEEIIYDFCDSLFINKYDYLDVFCHLLEIFYYYRSEVS